MSRARGGGVNRGTPSGGRSWISPLRAAPKGNSSSKEQPAAPEPDGKSLGYQPTLDALDSHIREENRPLFDRLRLLVEEQGTLVAPSNQLVGKLQQTGKPVVADLGLAALDPHSEEVQEVLKQFGLPLVHQDASALVFGNTHQMVKWNLADRDAGASTLPPVEVNIEDDSSQSTEDPSTRTYSARVGSTQLTVKQKTQSGRAARSTFTPAPGMVPPASLVKEGFVPFLSFLSGSNRYLDDRAVSSYIEGLNDQRHYVVSTLDFPENAFQIRRIFTARRDIDGVTHQGTWNFIGTRLAGYRLSSIEEKLISKDGSFAVTFSPDSDLPIGVQAEMKYPLGPLPSSKEAPR